MPNEYEKLESLHNLLQEVQNGVGCEELRISLALDYVETLREKFMYQHINKDVDTSSNYYHCKECGGADITQKVCLFVDPSDMAGHSPNLGEWLAEFWCAECCDTVPVVTVDHNGKEVKC